MAEKKPFDLLPCSLKISKGVTSPAMLKGIVGAINHAEKGVNWWAGDFVLHVEKLYGEDAYQFASELNFEQNTLNNCRWVAERIPPQMRREALKWSHHREVASLENPVDREKWLEKAELEGWTVKELKSAMVGEKEEKAVNAISIQRLKIRRDKGEISVWIVQKDHECLIHTEEDESFTLIELTAEEIAEKL